MSDAQIARLPCFYGNLCWGRGTLPPQSAIDGIRAVLENPPLPGLLPDVDMFRRAQGF